MVGTTAYVGANFFGLGILDVSESRGACRCARRSRHRDKPRPRLHFGSKIVVIDHMEGVVLVDASNSGKPVSAGSFFVDGYARDIVTSGAIAYAVDSPAGFYVLDLSAQKPMEPISALQTGAGLRTVEVSGSLAVLVGNGLIQLYDVSKPSAPVKIPPFKTPGGALRAAISGTTVYVADGREGVQVVDFSDRSAPKIVEEYETAGTARDVAVAGDLLFAVVTEPTAKPQDGGKVVILRHTR